MIDVFASADFDIDIRDKDAETPLARQQWSNAFSSLALT